MHNFSISPPCRWDLTWHGGSLQRLCCIQTTSAWQQTEQTPWFVYPLLIWFVWKASQPSIPSSPSAERVRFGLACNKVLSSPKVLLSCKDC